jgi:hypothetical protein
MCYQLVKRAWGCWPVSCYFSWKAVDSILLFCVLSVTYPLIVHNNL